MSTRILITGAGSYIGEKAKTYLTEKYGYQIDTIPTQNYEPKKEDFIGYDVVYNVAVFVSPFGITVGSCSLYDVIVRS